MHFSVRPLLISALVGFSAAARPKELAHDYLEREQSTDPTLVAGLVVAEWEKTRKPEQAPSASLGAEIDVTARPFENFKVRVGGTYLDSKVDGSYILSNPISGPPIDIGGEQFPATPRWEGIADAQYDHPISSRWTGFLGAGRTYNSEAPGAFGNIPSLQMPSYTLLDLRAGVTSDKWEVLIWSHNITDRYYMVHAFRPTDTLTATTGFPATFGITVSAHF
jgi:iron complex outermembrane receptor protein